jgi:PKD repeat protein
MVLPRIVPLLEVGSACENTAVAMTNTTSYDGTLETHWDFGDGTTGAGTSVTHYYRFPGVYQVRMRVSALPLNPNAPVPCEAVLVRNITVFRQPTAAFTVPELICEDQTFVAVSQSMGVGNNTFRHYWASSDGTLGDTNQFEHIHQAPGTYTLQLIVEDDVSRCQDTVSRQITVEASQYADFQLNYACEPLRIALHDRSDVLNATPWSTLFIDWGDGTIGQSRDSINYHTYAEAGNYQIVYRTTGFNGCGSVPVTRIIRVDPVLIAGMSVDAVCEDKTLHFQSTSTVNSPTLENGEGRYIVSWEWVFGDGTTSSEEHPTHIYVHPGRYPISLTITDNHGCTAQSDTTVQAFPPPALQAAADQPFICIGNVPNQLMFNADVSHDVKSVHWNFPAGLGNVVAGEGVNVALQLNDALAEGTYPVIAVATTQAGCVSMDTVEVIVYGDVEAAIQVNRLDYDCEGAVHIQVESISPIGNIYSAFEAIFQGDTLQYEGSTFDVVLERPEELSMLFITMTAAKDASCATRERKLEIPIYPVGVPDIYWQLEEESSEVNISFANASSGVADVYEWEIGELDDDLTIIPLGTFSESSFEYMIMPGKIYRVALTVYDSLAFHSTNPIECPMQKVLYIGDEIPGGIIDDLEDEHSPEDGVFVEISPLETQLPIFKMPTAFSPNGDGLHDVLRPLLPTDLSQLDSYLLEVYDEAGRLIYATGQPSEGWDGNTPTVSPANIFVGYRYCVSVRWKGFRVYRVVRECSPVTPLR